MTDPSPPSAGRLRVSFMIQSTTRIIKIGVVPMGEVSAVVTKVIAAHVSAFLNLQADVLPCLPPPIHALDMGRMQYDAGQVLSSLEKEKFQGYEKIIGVLSGDLFVPIFTHVMGEARQGGRCGLISLFRLEKKLPSGHLPPSQLLERCAKAALHELGHLFNLIHCSDPLCLMHICSDALELDQRRLSLCRYCRLFFENSPWHTEPNLDQN